MPPRSTRPPGRSSRTTILFITASLTVAAFLALPATPGRAASMVAMEVAVTVTPAACTPTLSNHGIIDYGTRSARDLNPDGYTSLPPMQVQLSVTCDIPAKFSIRLIDSRSNSLVPGILGITSTSGRLDDGYNFGLGRVDDKPVGGYAIRFVPASFSGDFRQVRLLSSADGISWSNEIDGYGSKLRQISWVPADATDSEVGAFKSVSGTISVHPYINRSSALPLYRDIELNGAATLELRYL